jgi:autotransporter-associated beta strand protein
LGAVTVVKDVGGAASGIVVEAGTVTATSMSIQGNGDKVANLNITGGSLVIGNSSSGGAFEVGTVGDGGVLTMTGGSLTYAGTDGLLLSPGAGVTATASITGSNAVATLTGITVNDGNSATGTSTLTVGGAATLYLGSVGLVVNLPSATTDAAFGTATVGAIAPWSSSAPISLTGTTTLQAADSNGNANNITLSGVLSGTGGLAVSGTGFVTLTAANTYTGSTTVNTGGRLIVSGSLSATAAATVASGGRLEVDGLLNNSITAVVNGRLSGTGVVGGAAINGTLAPGLTEADKSSAVGTLTAKGAISLASTATLNIRVGLTTGAASNPTTGLGGDVDQLFMNGGTFSLDDSSLQIFSNPAELGAAPDSLYVIINGGASATGTGTDVFAGIPASGDSITASNGNVFEVFYGVTAGSTTTPGSDIDVEFVAVPEPGAWTSLVGGIGMLIVWQRTRRRRT